MASALSVSDLRKSYGSVHALRGVDLDIGTGELFGLLGPNGAGKSTLVKIACGLVRPSGGGIAVCGHAAGSLRAQAALGYLAELFRFPDWLSADEVLILHQKLAASQPITTRNQYGATLVNLGHDPSTFKRLGATT